MSDAMPRRRGTVLVDPDARRAIAQLRRQLKALLVHLGLEGVLTPKQTQRALRIMRLRNE